MPQVLTKETRTRREPGQIKVSFKPNLNQLQGVSLTQEAKQEAMINLEGVAVTKMVQEIMKEEDQGTEMTDLNPKAGLNLRAEIRKVVSDVGKQTMSHKTVTSRKKPV